MLEWNSDITWNDMLGLVGVILYIGSYFSIQAGLIKGEGYLFAGLNTASAACVLLSLAENFNLSSAVIQITYIAISVFGIIRFYLLTHRIKFSEDEKIFLNAIAPNLHKIQARQLLDLGSWKTKLGDTVLTEEGNLPSHLYFLLDGSAEVKVAGNVVANLNAKSLVGEISCLTGMTASASVILKQPSRLFEINLTDLEDYLLRNTPVRHELESQFASQIGQKLIQANATLLTQMEEASPKAI